MSYATRADLEAAFSAAEIAQLESQGLDIEAALARAEEEVNSYLAVRYAVPVAPVTEHVKTVTLDIARYRIFPIESEGEPQERYERAIAWLKDVVAGRALLPGVTPAGDTGAAVPGVGQVRYGQAKSGFCWEQH